MADLVDQGTWGTWGYLRLRNACFPISMEMLQYVDHSCSPAGSIENVLKDLLPNLTLWNPDPACLAWHGHPRWAGPVVSGSTHGAQP